MKSRIQCFMIVPTAFARESLRRFVSSNLASKKCASPWGYHTASVTIGDMPLPINEYDGWGRDDFDHNDPRWPGSCSGCGQPFDPNDPESHWQHNAERYYARESDPNGPRFTLDQAPAGAMWFADWVGDSWRGPDGKSLFVVCPPGADASDHWLIDGPSKSNPKPWTRSGTPPIVTASPSILTPRYHGFLVNGFLEEC